MNVQQLYAFLNEKIPPALSCDWDNDGLMCCANPQVEVKKVLIALDITAAVIDEAVQGGYDLIVSHHPLIFSPLRALHPGDPVAKKVITLLSAGITAMSFHTRLDAVEGGVNDVFANALGLRDVVPFGENGETIGRIGTLPSPMTLDAFAHFVKEITGANGLQYSDAGREVCRVALLGGSGSSDVNAAAKAGADTYVTGELKHNQLTDAPERGMNLIAAGHFHTENAVCERIRELVLEAIPDATVIVTNSNPVKCI
ncbi:MAG: Nif3-like dinuclear metal center hexameric protein [Clostridia bacterium]|nr:Nif3-like dinuclear metal center hexameric protein [Clostridia bacterium]